MYSLVIHGPRLTLRDFTPDDVQAVAAYAADPLVTRYQVWGPNSYAVTAEWLTRTIAQAAQSPRHHFEVAVVENRSSRLVDGPRITIRSSKHRVGDIGYTLAREFWQRGHGTETARLLLRFGFGTLRLHRIEATCDPANVGARRVLEKSGMRRTCAQHQACKIPSSIAR